MVAVEELHQVALVVAWLIAHRNKAGRRDIAGAERVIERSLQELQLDRLPAVGARRQIEILEAPVIVRPAAQAQVDACLEARADRVADLRHAESRGKYIPAEIRELQRARIGE